MKLGAINKTLSFLLILASLFILPSWESIHGTQYRRTCADQSNSALDDFNVEFCDRYREIVRHHVRKQTMFSYHVDQASIQTVILKFINRIGSIEHLRLTLNN